MHNFKQYIIIKNINQEMVSWYKCCLQVHFPCQGLLVTMTYQYTSGTSSIKVKLIFNCTGNNCKTVIKAYQIIYQEHIVRNDNRYTSDRESNKNWNTFKSLYPSDFHHHLKMVSTVSNGNRCCFLSECIMGWPSIRIEDTKLDTWVDRREGKYCNKNKYVLIYWQPSRLLSEPWRYF